MSKTLTIIVENIPDDVLENYWESQKEIALKECGVPVEETELVKIDGGLLVRHYKDPWSILMAGIGGAHVIDSAHRILNKINKKT